MFDLNVMFNSFIGIILLGLSLLIIMPILWIWSAISVYKDAKYRNEKETFLTVFDIFGECMIVPVFYIINIVNPYNRNPENTPKRIPTGLLVKFIVIILVMILFSIFLSLMLPFGIGLIFVFIIAILSFLGIIISSINTASTFAMYKDSKLRGENNSLWPILAIFFPLISTILYIILVIKGDKTPKDIQGYSTNGNMQNGDFANQLSFDDINKPNSNGIPRDIVNQEVSNKIPTIMVVNLVIQIVYTSISVFYTAINIINA